MLSQRLMVIGCGLKTEDYLRKVMLNLKRFCQRQQLLESFNRVVKDHSLVQRFAVRRAEKGIVPLLGHVDAND